MDATALPPFELKETVYVGGAGGGVGGLLPPLLLPEPPQPVRNNTKSMKKENGISLNLLIAPPDHKFAKTMHVIILRINGTEVKNPKSAMCKGCRGR
jgi:hypothetical protein